MIRSDRGFGSHSSNLEFGGFEFLLLSLQRKMLKMVWCICLFHLISLSILGLTGAGQESVSFLSIHDTSQELMSPTGVPIGVSLGGDELSEVSGSVLKAETWLRTHVLAHYPSAQITTIVVGDSVLCHRDQEHNMGLVLPAMKNVYHSLVRWGLEREIKVSAAFSDSCLHSFDGVFRFDLAESVITPLLEFLHITNSTYSVKVSPLLDGYVSLVTSHSESMKKIGFLGLVDKIKVIVTTPTPKMRKPVYRKLSSMDSKVTFPQRPTPIGLGGDSTTPETTPPIHSSIGFSVPANVAKKPLPPLAQVASPPPFTFPFAPEMPPAASPDGFSLPPCNPVESYAPPPLMGAVQKLWCVAKPSVPPETLQEAMDYACGEGGGDCEEIAPYGNCYHPDTVVAHASYAFNSYWQKSKRHGGTCSFGGTAMLINADPSFLHCRFTLS